VITPKGDSIHVTVPKSEINVEEDIQALSRSVAEVIVAAITATLKTKPVFSMVLSGGSTPRHLYGLLATDFPSKEQLPWEKIHFFWGDERHVPPDHHESNYLMAVECMLSRLPVPPSNIHRIKSEISDASQVARQYEQEIANFFDLKAGQMPRFDCILLGMGPDGHTASLFPQTTALDEQKRFVAANWVESFQAHRITLTFPVLNNAESIIFLVSGEDKAETLKMVLEGEKSPKRLPAQMIEPVHGKLLWFIDQAAARELNVASQK
jgi:6-phosphogluconolactonase